MWGQPGKVKVTGFVNEGRGRPVPGRYRSCSRYRQPADINAVRTWHARPGVSLNIEQQVTKDLGVFARAGWADGAVEPWDFTDIDGTVQLAFRSRERMGKAGRQGWHCGRFE